MATTLVQICRAHFTHRRLKIFACPLVLFGFAAAAFAGTTYSVPALTGASIQATINTAAAAGPGNTVFLPAGIYNVASAMTVPCNNGLTITGPVATPSTAILNPTFSGNSFFSMYGCSGITIEYLAFQNTGGIYVGTSNYSGLNFNHLQFSALPSCAGTAGPNPHQVITCGSNYDAAIYLDGNINTVASSISIEYNTFGDSNSCTAAFAGTLDSGGYCAGIILNPGQLGPGFVAEYNTFQHVEEGIHFNNLLPGNATRGANQSTMDGPQIRFNYFTNWRRIATEIQPGVVNNALIVQDNIYTNPIPLYSSMFISDACCTGGRTYLNSPAANPANLTGDNVMYADSSHAINGQPTIGIEYWGGAGSNAFSNVEGGPWSNMINWGYAVAPYYISNNYLCGAHNGTYITDEEGSATPTLSGNVTSATCVQQTSAATTISPASGSYTSPPTVTLSNAGTNTSSYYTTDGSTPTPGSGTTKLYTGPFQITLPITIKAVGMWGVPPQPPVHEAPYGYQPSAVATATYTSTGGLALTSVTVNSMGSVHALNVGQTLQLMATCGYSDGSTTNCSTTDVNGNSVSNWTSSNTAAVTISGTGLATAVAAGATNITATVASQISPAYAMTSSVPTISLTGVSLATTGGVTTLAAGGQNQLIATCSYSDGSSDNCSSADVHGNDANFSSTATTVATVTDAGVVTGVAGGSTNLKASVQFGATQANWGQQSENTTGNTFPNYINATYVVFGSQMGGYSATGGTCSFYLPAGTLTVGAKYDCGLVPAPTPTTQGSSWQCWGTYTVPAASWAGGWITVPMGSCGTSNLAAGSTWWVSLVTNQSGASNAGFYNCGGSCNGAAPTTAGTGTFPCAYVADSYGSRTGMATAMHSGCGPVGSQAAQYVTLGQPPLTSNTVVLTVTPAAPTLLSAALTATGSPSSLVVGATLQFVAKCTYSNAQVTDCTMPDIYGSGVTSWQSDTPVVVSISSTGLASALTAGTANLTATIGGITSSPYALTVTAVPVTLTSLSLNLTNGITGLFVAQTNQIIPNCLFSDGSQNNCTGQTITYTSSNPSAATVSTGGLLTGVAPGTTNLTGSIGTTNSAPRPLTVLAVPSGVYTITISGPVQFSGPIQF